MAYSQAFKSSGGGNIDILNGVIEEYYSSNEDLSKYQFISFQNGIGTPTENTTEIINLGLSDTDFSENSDFRIKKFGDILAFAFTPGANSTWGDKTMVGISDLSGNSKLLAIASGDNHGNEIIGLDIIDDTKFIVAYSLSTSSTSYVYNVYVQVISYSNNTLTAGTALALGTKPIYGDLVCLNSTTAYLYSVSTGSSPKTISNKLTISGTTLTATTCSISRYSSSSTKFKLHKLTDRYLLFLESKGFGRIYDTQNDSIGTALSFSGSSFDYTDVFEINNYYYLPYFTSLMKLSFSNTTLTLDKDISYNGVFVRLFGAIYDNEYIYINGVAQSGGHVCVKCDPNTDSEVSRVKISSDETKIVVNHFSKNNNKSYYFAYGYNSRLYIGEILKKWVNVGIISANSTIDGLLISDASQNKKGKVYILN